MWRKKCVNIKVWKVDKNEPSTRPSVLQLVKTHWTPVATSELRASFISRSIGEDNNTSGLFPPPLPVRSRCAALSNAFNARSSSLTELYTCWWGHAIPMAQVREIVEARDHIVHLRCVIFAPTAESLKSATRDLGPPVLLEAGFSARRISTWKTGFDWWCL